MMAHRLDSIIFIGDKNEDYQELVKWAYENLEKSEVLRLKYEDYLTLKNNQILYIISEVCDLFGLAEGEDDAIYEKTLQSKLLIELEIFLKKTQNHVVKNLIKKIVFLLKKAISDDKVIVFFFL